MKERDFIAEAITEHWGERCDTFDAECPTCLAWKQYDLRASLRTEPAAWRFEWEDPEEGWVQGVTLGRPIPYESIRSVEPLYLHPASGEPVAWQRYSNKLGWTIVDATYARGLKDSGVAVRPLYASPPAPTSEGVAIKPLEWVSEPPYLVARVSNGHYAIEKWDGHNRFDLIGSFITIRGAFTAREDAKAAAQSDYEARIRSALLPAPTREEVLEAMRRDAASVPNYKDPIDRALKGAAK